MITVSQALDELMGLVAPVGTKTVGLADAGGRVMRADATARRDQPPFASSAMDGYAIHAAEAQTAAILQVIGEAAAGRGFDGVVKPGQAVRIFTGAPVPDGADKILIQEDCTRQGDLITVGPNVDTASYIRAAGSDFITGTPMSGPVLLGSSEISLLAAMNIPRVEVSEKPVIALVATGDELVMPGEIPSEDQIVSSNNLGLKAMVEAAGAQARILPLARDNHASLRTVLSLCEGADLIVTLGGASVGDHDLLGQMVQSGEIDSRFYQVAMRPGKPLLAGRYNETPLIGLPGNPVSSLVCGHVFLHPVINKMLGLDGAALPRLRCAVAEDLPQNGPREHYMRATIGQTNGTVQITPFARQDSSLLSVIAQANALLVRPPHDPAKQAGDSVEYLRL